MAGINKRFWLVLILAIVLVLAGIGYYVYEYSNRPDTIVGMWNGTIMHENIYYESTFNFTTDGYCNIALHPKPGMTYNVTQPTQPAAIKETVQWVKEDDHYNLIYPDGKVRLDNPNITNTLRFSEERLDGYKYQYYTGYISKNFQNLEDFSK
jgi:hypothetical protein